jgi:hypothetical protein
MSTNSIPESPEPSGPIDDYVARVVAEAPPLSDEQRARLAELLRDVPLRGDAV